jgi:hypothetical protein
MKKIKVTVGTRFVGSDDFQIIEVDDDLTEEEIEQIAIEKMWEMIEFSFKEVSK